MAGRSSDLLVLVIDVGPMMDIAPPMGGETPLESSIRIASQIVTQKLFSGSSKSEVGVVLFGTPETENNLVTEDGGYDNISVVRGLAPPDTELLRFIKGQIEMGGNNPADFIDAIVVGMDLIVKAKEEISKVGDKKIYLFTSCGSHYSDDGLDQIVSGLKQHDIQLIVIGPNIQCDDGDGGDNGAGGGAPPRPPPPSHSDGGSSQLKKTEQQLAGERVLARVVSALEGVAFTYPEALNVANVILKTGKAQTTRFAGELVIGPELKILCKVFTKTMLERPSTWKKLSAISQTSANPGSMAVKFDRSYHLRDEDETEVDSNNVVKGYRYGKSLIPVSTEDEDAMKLGSDKCMSLLGFTAMKHIKPHHIIGSSVQVVSPHPDDEAAMAALSSLIHALYEMDMVGVVRYVFRKNANPRLCALVPHIKPDNECLYMYQLPYMEDVRQYPFASLADNPKLQPSDDQLQAVDDLITNMELMEGDRDEDDSLVEAVKTKNISNILIQRTFQCIQHRSLYKEDPLPDVEPFLARLLEPPKVVQAKCTSSVRRVQELFPLVKVEKKQSTNPSEVWGKKSDIDLDTDEPVSKKPRTDDAEEDTDFSVVSLARGTIEEVGTVDPIGDYEKIISCKDVDRFEEASKQLHEVSLRLVKESFGDAMYDKALSCIRRLREEAIRHSEPGLFNEFIRNTRDDLMGTRYAPFWDAIKEAGISLITNGECPASSVTSEESKEFITDKPGHLVAEEVKEPEETEADDLLLQMD